MASNIFSEEDDRNYISLLQENINRMASNSANCKTWLITILAALLAVQASLSELRGLVWIALIPTVLFYFLDSYYLGLERRFIKIEERFINEKRTGHDTTQMHYDFKTKSIMSDCKATFYAMGSTSTWLFYLTIIAIVILIGKGVILFV